MIDEKWRKSASCKSWNLDYFFDYYEESNEIQLEVDALCANCPVMMECREFAQTNKLVGFFGRHYFAETNRKKEKVL